VPIISVPGAAHHLVDDARAGLPEAHAVAGAGGAQEGVDLVVLQVRRVQIRVGALVGADQVVTVDGGGQGDLVAAGHHELQDGHLGRGVLHGDAVGGQIEEALAPLKGLVLGVDHVGEQDLLAQGQRPAQAAAADRVGGALALVEGLDCRSVDHGVLQMSGVMPLGVPPLTDPPPPVSEEAGGGCACYLWALWRPL
jgi:hypothetical protein